MCCKDPLAIADKYFFRTNETKMRSVCSVVELKALGPYVQGVSIDPPEENEKY